MTLGTINDSYSLKAVIGSGAMGTVYRAVHQTSGKVFAIKHLKPELSTMEFVERFKRESDALRKLNHPNIVHLQEWVEADGNYYIVMEYLEGGSLSDLLRNKPLPLDRILDISLDLADALTRTHRLGIIHRDIKPSNILLDKDGTPRLTDFGIAHFNNLQTITSDGQMGTALYMAPEIVSEKPVSHHVDIWSFGVLLFEMVTGVRPFDRDSFLKTLMAIINDDLPDIEELNADCPIELVDLIYRMLEKDVNQRIQSVRLVGAELEKIIALYNKDNSMFKAYSDSQMRRNLFEPSTDTAIARAERTPNNLPLQISDFVGRRTEVAELGEMLRLRVDRLVTIVAPGGMGKTRLSIEVAKRQLSVFTDGVFFIDLYPVADVADIPVSIAEDINFQFHTAEDNLEHQLVDYLENKNILLVLDNYEDLVDDTALIEAILETTEHVSIVVTSRHPLRIPREKIYTLRGMSTTTIHSGDDLGDVEAVKLFLQTARSLLMTFEPRGKDLELISEIVEAVQGMPLAIMLAASWVKILSLDEILREIHAGIDILEDSSTHDDYAANIRNVLDYSWNLLTSEEQETFAHLSVFAEGFTRASAQAVTNASLRVIMNLMNYSMLWRNTSTGRYQIHSLLRQYARQKLVDQKQEAEVRSRHARHFLEYLASLEEKLRGSEQVETLDAIEVDFENIRLAWQWAIDNKDAEHINSATEALNFFCDMRSYTLVGLQLFEEAYQEFSTSRDAKIHYVGSRCHARWIRMNISSMRKITESMRIEIIKCAMLAQQQSDMQELGFCYWLRGIINDSLSGELEETIAMFQTSLELFEETRDRFYQADVMGWLGIWRGYIEPEVGHEYARKCLDIQEQIGNPNGIAWGLLNLAYSSWNHQNYKASIDYARQCLESMRTIRHRKGILDVQRLLGHQHILRGAFTEAEIVLKKAYDASVALVAGTHKVELGLQLALLACLKDNDCVRGQALLNQALEQSNKTHAFAWFFPEAVEVIIAIGLKEYHGFDRLITRLNRPPAMHTHLIFAAVGEMFLQLEAGNYGRCAMVMGAIFQQDDLVTTWIKKWDATHNLMDELKDKLGDRFDYHWETGTSTALESLWGNS